MMEMNMELFKKYMDNSPYTRTEIAERIEMNIATFYRRLKGNSFTVNEFLQISKLLRLSVDQINQIQNLK